MSTPTLRGSLPAIVTLLLAPALPGRAQTNVYPFDFEVSIAADPAGVQQRIDELAEGVPPIPAGDLIETAVGPMTLFFHEEMLERLENAFASGPGLATPFARDAVTCVTHDGFSLPDALAPGASLSC